MPNATAYLPERGDIFWLVLDPRTGHEQSGRRPVIAVSSKQFSQHTSLAVVCPITSKIKGLPYEIPLETTKTIGSILPIHIRSVDVVARKAVFIEKAPANLITKLQQYVSALIET